MISLRIHQETNHSGKHLVEKITKQKGHTFINHYHLSESEVSELVSKFENKNNIEFVKNSGSANIQKDGPWASVQTSSQNKTINHPEYNRSGELLNTGLDSYRNTMVQKTPMSNSNNNSIPMESSNSFSGYDQYDSLYSSYSAESNRVAKDRNGNSIQQQQQQQQQQIQHPDLSNC